MKLGHIHIGVTDLENSVNWMRQIFKKEPAYQNQNMAFFPLEGLGLIFDRGESDAEITVAFDSNNCDSDYARLTERGAETVEAPTDQPWGVRAAYIKGPGKVTFELEQPLK